MTEYTMAYIFTKKTNLMPYYHSTIEPKVTNPSPELIAHYAELREVETVVQCRWERMPNSRRTKLICKVKGPISPLPVKGEFVAPSMAALHKFFEEQGWKFKERFCPKFYMH